VELKKKFYYEIRIMEPYISKSDLVAEIEKLMNHFNTCQTLNSYEDGLKEGRLIGYEDALDKINALEVKEIDLDALGVLAEHLITCDARLVTPKYTDKELDLLEEWAKNNKAQKGE
jgi:hypothetical protein